MAATGASTRPEGPTATGPAADSAFAASGFERRSRRRNADALIGWRRRILVFFALVGCLGVFTLARWLAEAPQLEGDWGIGPGATLVLQLSRNPELDAHRGRVLRSIAGPRGPALEVDALLLHRSPRWQVDDSRRRLQIAEHRALAALLTATPTGPLTLNFDDGASVRVAVHPRGLAGLGIWFWPLVGLALLLFLFGVVVMLARPRARNLLFVVMAWCQSANLLLIAIETSRGLGLPAALLGADLPLRAALDLCTGAAAVHALALHPRRLRHALPIAAAGWAGVLVWVALMRAGHMQLTWWWAQAVCMALGAAALAVVNYSHRIEPNPYALVMRRFAAAALGTLVLVTAAVAFASVRPEIAPRIATGVSVSWYLFLASLLLLTPFLSRSRELLREFAMLAGISTVATSLDLLFVSVFALGSFTSLALAVFVALGVYAAARQWILNHLIGSSVLTTERTFEELYRAARAVQTRPSSYPDQLSRLLRQLFEPIEMLPASKVLKSSRVLGGGSALVVPMRAGSDDSAGSGAALVLRFGHGGKRLFTVDDARLADRLVEQLRRAIAYDRAVERGRHEERLRIAQDLHDDIGARLLTLMYRADSPELEDYIRHTLQDLKTLTRGLAAGEHKLSHAAGEWKADIAQRLGAAHVAFAWEFNHDQDVALSMVQWSALTRVLRELVSNALFHGHASAIDVHFALDGGLLELQVGDDGCGRNPASWAHGLGLGGIRKRIKLLGGEVHWHERLPRGIVCTVRVADFAGRA